MMNGDALSFVVVGASGDLARKKVIPALFALFCQGLLPAGFRVFGFARSPFDHAAFREKIVEHLTCRYAPGESCADRMAEFLARCFYCAGEYGSPEGFLNLYQLMREIEPARDANRIFYLAIPPDVFLDVARALGSAGLVVCGSPAQGWSRVVIEKPFGRDRASSDQLVREMGTVFTEDQTYRIDHYLGKEVVQNLMVLRFGNRVFQPVWNRDHVERVEIVWKEDIGVEERGGYFDHYGIIRDVIQNHLMQILALLAMEEPERYDAMAVRNEKVRLLRQVPALGRADLVIGQYAAAPAGAPPHRAYTAEAHVPPDSRTPTYAAARLRVHNRRWEGVPFLLQAGKGLDGRVSEIRIKFRPLARNIFGAAGGAVEANELVIRIQPDESIHLRVMNKVPGMGLHLQATDLNLRYQAAFKGEIPDAYERLLLDVMEGDKGLFIRADELAGAWDIFTPVLQQLEQHADAPFTYPFGSAGPAAAAGLLGGAGA